MAKKIVSVVVALIFVIGISVGTALLMDKTAVPASTTIENGLSAYELAVQYGYEGTVQEYLESLNGKSAYEIAVSNGYSGTEDEWIAAINAAATQPALSITTAKFSSDGELIIVLSDGTELNVGKVAGTDGKDGADGKDGVSISGAKLNGDGQLVITYSDGNTVNLDTVVGMNGTDGIGIEKSEINANGELVLAYTNGQQTNLGCVIGTDGKDGINGADGVDGKDAVSIAFSDINTAGELIITYSDGKTANLGKVVGADGKNGVNGINGTDGKDGVGIQNITISIGGELQIALTNGTTMNLGNIKGTDGKDGVNGIDGKDGVNGADGQDGVGISSTTINALGELIITYSDGNETNLGKVAGIDGKDGIDGVDGVGISKTEIDADGKLIVTYSNGHTDTLGKIVGTDGRDGADGAPGKDGVNGEDGIGITSTTINAEGELTITYSDGNFVNLGKVAGIDGSDGVNGTDGIGIKKTEISADGKLIITYSDGKVETLGVVVGANGKDGANGINGVDGTDGVGIAKTEVNAAGELLVAYTDGSSVNLGKIAGKDGKDGTNGTNGVDGKDGISVSKTEINADGELLISYSNGEIENVGKVVGTNGKDGVNGNDGKDGTNGTDGEDGVGITKAEIVNGELILHFSNNTSINLGNIKGTAGKDGTNGTNGTDGRDGVGIETVTVSESGELSVKLTSGAVLNLGNIKGKDGIGISKSEINADGELVLTYTSGEKVKVGKVVGSDGNNGTDGKDGVGISGVTVSPDGELTVILTDTTTLELGNIRGPQGEKGDVGANGSQGPAGTDGKDGINGTNGVGVSNAYVNSELHLIIVLTDGTEIDAGYVGVPVDDNTKPAPEPVIPTTYTVTFKDWDGRVLKTETVESGHAATAPDEPTRSGYTFVAWDVAFTNVTSDLTVTAKYEQNSTIAYTVVFVDYDGTELSKQTVNKNGSATLPENPTRNGYIFTGWQGKFTKVTKNETVTAVYAKWKAHSFSLLFDANGGNCSEASRLVLCDTAFGTLPTPTKTGFTFGGWFTAGGEQITADSRMATATDITVFARWTVNSYKVSWNTGDGYTITVNRTSSPNAGAATGTLGNGAAIYYGDVLAITYVKQDYYYIIDHGATSVTVTGDVNSSSIYASAGLNPVSSWVRASDMPYDAQVINTKWTYTLREFTSNSASSLSGWTNYETQRTGWGATQGPMYSDPSNGVRNVWSESYETGRTHHWVYYRWQNPSNDYGSDVQSNSYKNYQEIDLTYQLTESGTMGVNSRGYKYWQGSTYDTYWLLKEYDDIHYGTRWYYQEPIYTYYYYRDVNLEATSDPTGQSNVSGVIKWVQYRAK